MPRRPRPRLFDWSKYDPSMPYLGSTPLPVEELVTYRDHLPELLKDKGRYVLIKGHEIIGIYDTRDEALDEAANRFREARALVKRIAAKERMIDLGGVAY
jgi:hypothetical protein